MAIAAASGHARRPATITVDDMDSQTKELSEFCGVLWREREIVERVLFKVLGQQLVLKSGQTRWLVAANTEIELAVNDLRVIEVMRCAEADRLAEQPRPGATARRWPNSPTPRPSRGAASWPSTATRCAISPNEIDHAVRENRSMLVDGATRQSARCRRERCRPTRAPRRAPAVESPAVPGVGPRARRCRRRAGRGPGPHRQHAGDRSTSGPSIGVSAEFELGLRDVAVAAAYQASMRTAATIRQRSLAEFLK